MGPYARQDVRIIYMSWLILFHVKIASFTENTTTNLNILHVQKERKEMDKLYVKDMKGYLKEVTHSIKDSNIKIEFLEMQIENDRQYLKCLKERRKIEKTRREKAEKDLNEYINKGDGK